MVVCVLKSSSIVYVVVYTKLPGAKMHTREHMHTSYTLPLMVKVVLDRSCTRLFSSSLAVCNIACLLSTEVSLFSTAFI